MLTDPVGAQGGVTIDLTAFAVPFRVSVSVERSHGLSILRLSLRFPMLTDPVGAQVGVTIDLTAFAVLFRVSVSVKQSGLKKLQPVSDYSLTSEKDSGYADTGKISPS